MQWEADRAPLRLAECRAEARRQHHVHGARKAKGPQHHAVSLARASVVERHPSFETRWKFPAHSQRSASLRPCRTEGPCSPASQASHIAVSAPVLTLGSMPQDRVEVLTSEVLEHHLPDIARASGQDVADLVKEAFGAALQRCQEVAKELHHEGPLSDIPKAARRLVQELEAERARLARLSERFADLDARFTALHQKAHDFAERNAELAQQLDEAEHIIATLTQGQEPPEYLPH